MKKVLSLMLALVMCLGLLPATALAAGNFSIDSNNVLTKYNGPGGDVTIPDGVTAIGNEAFYGRADVTGVTIPDSVTMIESPLMGNRGAFGGCTGLTSIELPDSITQIGRYAFSGCTGLTSVVIPDSVTFVGDSAFQGCTGLTSAVIGSGLKDAGSSVFSGCSSLSSVTLKEGITSIPDNMFERCASLTSIKIPDSVTKIGLSAFYGCSNLSSVDFGNGSKIYRLWAGTFGRCAKLKEITLPASLQRVDDIAFRDIDFVTNAGGPTELESITYAEGTTTIPVVMSPTVTEVHVPASVTAVQDGAFDSYSDLTVYGVAGSYMEGWCSMREIPFVREVAPAIPTNDKLTVNGVPAEPTVYKINGGNYFKLRDLAVLLNGTSCQFDVGYDEASGLVTADSGKGYTKLDTDMRGPVTANQTATLSKDKIIINGQVAQVEVYKIDGSNYFKLRDLGRALDFYVGYSKEAGVFIETDKPYSE